MQKVQIRDLGLVGYIEALQIQEAFQKELIEQKRSRNQQPEHHYLVFCHHHPVYTLGKSGHPEHLLYSRKELESKNIEFYKTGRGGDITFHGPGQLIVYPIFDLDFFFTDVHRFVRSLEEVVIRSLQDFDIFSRRIEGFTGVWLGKELEQRKVCAIGVHLSRWVSKHGLALNVNTELSYFDGIVPCGIQQEHKSVTSMAKELGSQVNMQDVKQSMAKHFSDVFDFEYQN